MSEETNWIERAINLLDCIEGAPTMQVIQLHAETAKALALIAIAESLRQLVTEIKAHNTEMEGRT